MEMVAQALPEQPHVDKAVRRIRTPPPTSVKLKGSQKKKSNA
jgi:hypothetical protein